MMLWCRFDAVMLFQISENLLGAEFQDEQDIDVFCKAFAFAAFGGVTVLCFTCFVYAVFALVLFDFPNNAVFAAVELWQFLRGFAG
ncbi:hypothetical protein [Neisseria iguanae]|uniref:hypothetical protein n=1 Tax=Neisseria iguanae TaxID=90242 RepID=UPI0011B28BBC|nr:hypothetical protein [Neisseria iguanae]